MAKSDIKSQVYSFDVDNFKNLNDMLSFGKQTAQFVNRRLNALQKEGLLSNATSGGVKKIDVRKIKTKAQAVRAVSKARQLLSNPLSTPGEVKKLFRKARDEYGSSGQRMKIIAVETKVLDENGNWTGVMKLVPKAVPWGTNKDATAWYKAEQQIKSFWNWYHDEMEQWVASDEAQQMWEESRYVAREAKRKVMYETPMGVESGFAQTAMDEISKIMKTSKWTV